MSNETFFSLMVGTLVAYLFGVVSLLLGWVPAIYGRLRALQYCFWTASVLVVVTTVVWGVITDFSWIRRVIVVGGLCALAGIAAVETSRFLRNENSGDATGQVSEGSTGGSRTASIVSVGDRNKDNDVSYKGPARNGDTPAAALGNDNSNNKITIQVDPGSVENKLMDMSHTSNSSFNFHVINGEPTPEGQLANKVHNLAIAIVGFRSPSGVNISNTAEIMPVYEKEFSTQVTEITAELLARQVITQAESEILNNPTDYFAIVEVGRKFKDISYTLYGIPGFRNSDQKD